MSKKALFVFDLLLTYFEEKKHTLLKYEESIPFVVNSIGMVFL